MNRIEDEAGLIKARLEAAVGVVKIYKDAQDALATLWPAEQALYEAAVEFLTRQLEAGKEGE